MDTKGRPGITLYVMLLAATGLVLAGEQATYLEKYPAAWVVSLLLLIVTAVPAGLIIYRFDQFEPEPVPLVIMALIWGGVIALIFSAYTNTYFLTLLQAHLSPGTYQAWGAAIVAPIDEEFYKAAGLVVLFLIAKHEFDGVMDGLVYGAMIGLGFQVMEDVQYFLQAASSSGGQQVGAVARAYVVRVLLAGLYSHTLFTGMMGFGFADFVTHTASRRLRRWGVFVMMAVVAWAAHFLWNSPLLGSLAGDTTLSFFLSVVVKGVPFLGFLIILAVFARRRERQVFDALIAVEVGGEVVTETEFKTLERGSRRRAALRHMRRAHGPAGRGLLKRLQREQMNLALLHSKRRAVGQEVLEQQRETIRGLKRQLAALG